jgi:hypothetical protein
MLILFMLGIEDEHEVDNGNDFANAFFKQPQKPGGKSSGASTGVAGSSVIGLS